MKDKLLKILNIEPFKPKELIDALKSNNILKTYFLTKIRHYVLETHTLLVMNEFEKYFSHIKLPIDKKTFRLFLALHDIGKAKAFKQGNKGLQYLYSVNIINEFKQNLPVKDCEINILLALVKSDILGEYLQNKTTLKNVKDEINTISKEIEININDFIKLLTIYYQVDAGSYTQDAGGLRYLENVFEYENNKKKFDNTREILIFSPIFKNRYDKLVKLI